MYAYTYMHSVFIYTHVWKRAFGLANSRGYFSRKLTLVNHSVFKGGLDTKAGE